MDDIQFTVDLEDYYHAVYPPDEWAKIKPRIEEPVRWLLYHLDKFNIRATFYVLGHVAWGHPEMVKKIFMQGHRIGSHGYWHQHNEQFNDASDRACIEELRKVLPYMPDRMPYRSPYWDNTPLPGRAGGAFFRLLPYPWTRDEVLKERMFWIHPHDLDPGHPELEDKFLNIKRHFGLRNSRKRLVRLMEDVNFERR